MSTYLEPSHHKSWETNGFLKISGFFSDSEVAALRQWVAEIESWEQDPVRWLHHYESVSDGTRLSRTENFIPYHEGMKSTLTTAKVSNVISELNGEPAVLYKEKINYKYPGGGGYAPHQDAPAYEFVKNHTTCLISIDAATVENGCLYFSPGRHREGMIALDADGCIAPGVADSMEWVPAPTQPGDILLFSSYIPHKSGANGSSLPRRIIYAVYNNLSDGDWRDKYYEDKRQAFSEYAADDSGRSGQISKIAHFRGRTVLNVEE